MQITVKKCWDLNAKSIVLSSFFILVVVIICIFSSANPSPKKKKKKKIDPIGLVDPYVILHYGDKMQRTRYLKKTCNPEYNLQYKLPLPNDVKVINIEVTYCIYLEREMLLSF